MSRFENRQNLGNYGSSISQKYTQFLIDAFKHWVTVLQSYLIEKLHAISEQPTYQQELLDYIKWADSECIT